ncbi:hypothetical protein OPU71_20620 [Niveibacterium sp. 24ML]|uniref:hypothetical protein n=1 Tax=Niveibacterium sp. 24ML TaxID=2985512 RepID=UPI00226FD2B0|nr:hypothetical protein [Niveibacterium sp. 24ML]MCX9158534.1 hypothetical protein [Niveibacterium sp. 24ML]
MSESIIRELSLGAGLVRSISIERDLYDKQALQNYLVTPAVVTALEQLGRALESNSPQRAWKVVGPYGSGKSALGVAAGQLLSGEQHFNLIAEALATQSKRVSAIFADSSRYPVALVGSRVSLGVALARSFLRVTESWSTNKATSHFIERLDLDDEAYNGVPLNAAVSLMVRDFADAAEVNGFQGIVVLVDELGKFVEHAALYPAEGDLMALQQLAESACGGGDSRISVVAFLHQHMSAYADGLGKALSDDWEKVASRFEEIPFDEPVERYVHFASHALGLSSKACKHPGLATKARALFGAAVERGLLKFQGTADHDLLSNAEQLYPLHPSVIAAMAIVAKRMGQSERSFHAFLSGDEPHALRDFSSRHDVDANTWYRLDNLWDHLACSHSLRFRERNAERRWAFAASCVAREIEGSLAAKVLKVIAMAELIEQSLRLPVSVGLVQHALDDVGPADVACAIDELVRKGVVQLRRGGEQVVTAVPELANIDALLEEAGREKEAVLVTRALETALSSRPVVAHRHYDRTGTLRTLAVLVGTVDTWPQVPRLSSEDAKPDGWLKLLIIGPSNREMKQATDRCKQELHPLELHACLQPHPAARIALAQYAVWLSVANQLRARQLDPWATQYVERQLASSREEVDEVISALLGAQLSDKGPRKFWHLGKEVPHNAAKNLSQLASWLFDEQFSLAPRVVNELINKDRPTSAIVLARQRMFDVLFSNDHTKPICGPNEFPPERLIHRTLLLDTGIWTDADGRWSLSAPKVLAHVNAVPVWEAIADFLSDGAGKTFAELLDKIAAPPLGVRNGPGGIWVAMYLMVNRSTCAVFERGTLVLELTAEHLQRMYKAPAQYEVKEIPASVENHAVLEDYRAALATVGCQVEGSLTALEVARATYRWVKKLPAYALHSGRVSKDTSLFRTQLERSRDHIDLLFRAVPQVHHECKSKHAFRLWLATVLGDLGASYRRLQEEVGSILSASFEIAGTLPRVRQQLQKECSSATTDLAEANLRAFVLRCADPTLSDERWLDSLASLIVHKPLDSWTDATLTQFEAVIIELCAQYKRWVRLVSHRARNPALGERYVSVTMTLPSGHESAVFVVADPVAKIKANEVLKDLERTSKGSHEQMLAILGQALLTLQSSRQPNGKDREDDGQKTGQAHP